jgi:glycosyltransferase domain-containing protein
LEPEELNNLFAHESVTYKKFDPDIFFEDKIARGVTDISTPYATLCGDDDFIIPTGVKECIKFLEQNPDYSCAQGLYIHHIPASKGKARKFRWVPIYIRGRSINHNRAYERITEYLDLGHRFGCQHYYAIHRSETLKLIRKETAKYAPFYSLGELFSGCLSLIYGKRKILPVFFSSREPHSLPLFDEAYHRSLYAPKKLEKAIQGITKHLQKAEGPRFENAELVARKSLNARVDRIVFSKRLYYSSSYIPKILYKLIGLKNAVLYRLFRIRYSWVIENESSPYYSDFLRVKDAVISAGLDPNEADRARGAYQRAYQNQK